MKKLERSRRNAIVFIGTVLIFLALLAAFRHVEKPIDDQIDETAEAIQQFYNRYKTLPLNLTEIRDTGYTENLPMGYGYFIDATLQYSPHSATEYSLCDTHCKRFAVENKRIAVKKYNEAPFLGISFEYPEWFGNPDTWIAPGYSYESCAGAGFRWGIQFQDSPIEISGATKDYRDCIPRDGYLGEKPTIPIEHGVYTHIYNYGQTRIPLLKSGALADRNLAWHLLRTVPAPETVEQTVGVLTDQTEGTRRAFMFILTDYAQSLERPELKEADIQLLEQLMQSARISPTSPLR